MRNASAIDVWNHNTSAAAVADGSKYERHLEPLTKRCHRQAADLRLGLLEQNHSSQWEAIEVVQATPAADQAVR